jgi:hypothetical protein
MGEVYSDY